MARECSVDGCQQRHAARGFCHLHYARWSRHGDPNVVLPRGGSMKGTPGRKGAVNPMFGRKGAAHPRWKGDDVNYDAAHQRVRARFGSAKGYICPCGEPASEWAYDHAAPNEKTGEDGRPYSPDPTHYIAMCKSCHVRFDYATSHRAEGA